MGAKYTIVLNASNLRGGGAVQVAVSLISELLHMPIKGDIVLILSSVVFRECTAIGVDFKDFRALHQIDHFGFKPFNKGLQKIFRGADLVFTVFGPLYLWRRPKISVVGFAQPWILYPGSEAYQALPRSKRAVTRLKYAAQQYFFRRNSNMMIVEAEHAQKRLAALFPNLPVVVVPNALNGVFLDAISSDRSKALAKPVLPPHHSVRHVTLGHVGRAYSHFPPFAKRYGNGMA